MNAHCCNALPSGVLITDRAAPTKRNGASDLHIRLNARTVASEHAAEYNEWCESRQQTLAIRESNLRHLVQFAPRCGANHLSCACATTLRQQAPRRYSLPRYLHSQLPLRCALLANILSFAVLPGIQESTD